jgi:hypothetical protein
VRLQRRERSPVRYSELCESVGREALSLNPARESFVPIGSNLLGFDNYFCRDCRRIIHVRKGSPGFRACPTPGCTRPTGLGAFAKVQRLVKRTGRATP